MTEMNAFTSLKFRQLEIAHQSTVLFYTRDRSSSSFKLARKLKSEFCKVYVTGEVRESVKLLGKFTNHSQDVTGVDVILMEFDGSVIKLVDYVIKRAIDPQTNACPLIPVIVLMNEGNVGDAEDQLKAVGGVNKIIYAPFSTKQVFLTLLDVLYNRANVEGTFRNLRLQVTIASKYPYLPIFKGKAPWTMKQLGSDADSMMSGSNFSTDEANIEEIEEASDCSSMLPDEVKETRQQRRDLLSPYRQGAEVEDSEHRKAFQALMEKAKLRERTGTAIAPSSGDPVVHNHFSRGREAFILKVAAPKNEVLINPLQSEEAKSDAARVGVKRPSIDSSVLREELQAEEEVTHINPNDPQSKKLLNPLHRPFWSEDVERAKKHLQGPVDALHEITPFLPKQPTHYSKPSTVSGLDKRAVEHHWRSIRRSLEAEAEKKLEDATKHGALGALRLKAAKAATIESLARQRTQTGDLSLAPGVLSHHGSAMDEASAAKTPKSRTHVRLLSRVGTTSSLFSEGTEMQPESRRMSIGAMSCFSGVSRGDKPQTVSRIYRKIANLAQQSRTDIQLQPVLDVEFASRSINLGEKDMLQRGLNLESNGEFDAAIACYTRAGVHSKDAHVSRLLLGNLHYRQDKLLGALKHYNAALQMVMSRPAPQRSGADVFLAHFNRAIVHFRLGDDEAALRDLETAAEAQPSHIRCCELISLAKRRLGRFQQAIDCASVAKNLRHDHQDRRGGDQSRVTASQLSGGKATRRGVTNSDVGGDKDSIAPRSPVQELLPVPDSVCHGGLRGKVQQSDRLAKGPISAGADGDDDAGLLKTFKLRHGQKPDLFDELFKRPSDLQAALLIEPQRRLPQHCEAIAQQLRLVPFLAAFSDSAIWDLAAVVEYRALSAKQAIFEQDEETCAAVIVLSGSVQARLKYPAAVVDFDLGSFEALDIIGHIDFLFRSPNLQLVKEIEDILLSRPPPMPRRSSVSVASPHRRSLFASTLSDSDSDGSGDDAMHAAAQLALSKEASETHRKAVMEWRALWGLQPDGDNGASQRQPRSQTFRIRSRALLPGAFASFTLNTPSELLFIDERRFLQLVYDAAMEDLRRRLQALRACRVFASWRPEDIVRLARMGRVQHVKKGTTLVSQGQRSDCFYIVLKGLCRALKRPDRSEMLQAKLEAARERAERIDMKYVFHHKTGIALLDEGISPLLARRQAEKQDEKQSIKSIGSSKNPSTPLLLPQLSSTSASMFSYGRTQRKNKKSASHLIHASENAASSAVVDEAPADPVARDQAPSADAAQQETQSAENESMWSLESWKVEWESREVKDLMEEIHAIPVQIVLPESRPTAVEEERMQLALEIQRLEALLQRAQQYSADENPEMQTITEIAVLQWPMFFGEACVLDPEAGINRASVVADTACELFVLHKKQIQTFAINDAFLQRVKDKSIAYPADADIVLSALRQREWQSQRQQIVRKNVNMHLWPRTAAAPEPFLV